MNIKICGLCRPEDAAAAAGAGATHAGVIRVRGTARWRPIETARSVLDAAGGLRRVGVFAETPLDELVAEARELGLDVVQLHAGDDPDRVAALRAEGFEVWKVVKPSTAESLVAEAEQWRGADLLLLEGASDRGLGGVGARFDWQAASSVIERLPSGLRLGVAGGLTAENVAEAVALLDPWLVDVSSGVESSQGVKDEGRVRAFIARARVHSEGREAR